jgi:hypothetical protein
MNMAPLDLVNLSGLMELTTGKRDIVVGLIDGPVATDHADLAGSAIWKLPGKAGSACSKANSQRRLHARHIHCGHPPRPTRLGSAGHLPELRVAGLSHLRRRWRQQVYAERHA